jgi:hypothetical protein
MRERRSFLGLILANEPAGSALLFFVICLIAVPPGLWNMPALYRDAGRLERDGAETSANVMALEKTTGEHPRHLVSYAFQANGTWFEGQTEVPEDMFKRLRVEDRVPIRYWSKDPALTEIEPDMRESEFWGGMLLRGLILACVLPFLIYGIWHAVRVRWLVRNGVPIEAEVLEIVQASKDDEPLAWKARWIGPGGQTGLTEKQPALRTPPVGSVITILTDPTGRRGCVWDGDT